ncbi:MAG: phytanoyl-CoA dioxygenase family protein [Alphaproteobacteria bacterium]|nr:phytanoyl-CoA dioxygenase family protein [Alphaproteobacteria bacterium]
MHSYVEQKEIKITSLIPLDLRSSRCFVYHVKGLFSKHDILNLRSHFNKLTAIKKEEASLSEREKLIVKLGGMDNKIRMDEMWYQPWKTYQERISQLFYPYSFIAFPTMIRHVTTEEQLVPWHQDISYQNLLGARGHQGAITCFTPLEEEPNECSTLEFASGDFSELPHLPYGDHGAKIINCNFVSTQSFSLSTGDVLVFGDMTPHRTIPAKNGCIDRVSLEYRLSMKEDMLIDKDYFNIEKGLFVKGNKQ